jgi:phage terminase large subunit-like protein
MRPPAMQAATATTTGNGTPPAPPRTHKERAQGRLEKLARERHLRDLELAAQPGGHPRGLWFDWDAGERAIQFIERYCKHHKAEWAGRALLLEQWQKDDFIRPLFGWKRADGSRRYRTALIEIARKNGKSELVAALALYLLVCDEEPGAEIYSSATKKDQAKIVWDTSSAMVRASKRLKKFVRERRSNGGVLLCDKLDSKFVPLGADSKTLDGLNPHGNLVDELHAHRDRSVWDVLDTALGSRRQPLTIAITTAGVFDKESIGWEIHDHGVQVLEAAFEDDEFFALIYSPDEGDDPLGTVAQEKANPNIDVSVKRDYLERQARKAKRQPRFFNEYCRLHTNVWTQQVTRWLRVDRWLDCEPQLTSAVAAAARAAREQLLLGRKCYGGADLSSKLDITAFVLAFPMPAGVFELLCRFYMPEDRIADLYDQHQRHFRQWADDGWICATPGEVIDYDFIRSDVNALGKLYRIDEIGFDPWNATQFATDLGEGDGFKMVEVRQGYGSMSEPSKSFEALITSRKIRHQCNPVLRWMVGNAVCKTDPAGNIKPDKEKAKNKIDGVVASTIAVGRANFAIDTNPYTGDRGLLTM